MPLDIEGQRVDIKKHNESYPKFIHVQVGEHWVKCGQEFGDNYVMLYQNEDEEGHRYAGTPENAQCVVCGRKTTEHCVARDT